MVIVSERKESRGRAAVLECKQPLVSREEKDGSTKTGRTSFGD